MANAASMRDHWKTVLEGFGTPRKPPDLNIILLRMRGRHSSNPIDKVCAIAFPFQKRGSFNFHNITFPIYDPNTEVSVAWERLISSIASAKMEADDLIENSYLGFYRTSTIQLLCLFPHPSRHHWFPSWAQVQQYPDVSVQDDDDPVPVSEDIDYSLRIMSGRIYRGCSLELKQPPTPKGNATYHCFMGSKLVELVATVPGIELNIDSKSTYVLVDISPDHSLWPSKGTTNCHRSPVLGHVHLPIWRKSVIIVCEEVDCLAQPPVQVTTTSSPAILRYRLRRVTTLKWDCRSQKGSYRWLPFKPSLEHMRSVVCSAEDTVTSLFPPPDVFCDPAAVAVLPIENGRREWDKCPVYEVYLV